MVHLLKEVGMEMSHAEMEMFFNRLDPNHDGQITLQEMQAVFEHQEDAKTADYKLSNVN
jgi:Ca2+-binding EF-hand superfamily protein